MDSAGSVKLGLYTSGIEKATSITHPSTSLNGIQFSTKKVLE
jgi:hypothetical protein